MVDDLALYYEELAKIERLKEGEESELAAAIAHGDRGALDRMVQAHLELVVQIARRNVGRGLPLADLIGEGNLGLVRAAEDFDPGEGTFFSDWATFWIRAAIRRALNKQAHYIRIPPATMALLLQWRKKSIELTEQLGHRPLAAVVVRELGWSKQRARWVARAERARALTRMPEGQAGEGLSLDALLTDDGPGSDEEIEREDLAERISLLVSELERRKRRIVSMRFGLEPFPPTTFKEIAASLHLTLDHTRQLYKEAIVDLFHTLQSRPLRTAWSKRLQREASQSSALLAPG